MTRCRQKQAAFVRAEIKAHYVLETQGKGRAYKAAEKASERAYDRGRGCSWQVPRKKGPDGLRAGRRAGLGLPPLQPGGYPKGAALAAACRALRSAYLRAKGYSPRASGLYDRAMAMRCPWAFKEHPRRVG